LKGEAVVGLCEIYSVGKIYIASALLYCRLRGLCACFSG